MNVDEPEGEFYDSRAYPQSNYKQSSQACDQFCEDHSVHLCDKLTAWITNIWVIIIIGLILLLVVIMILYYWQPEVVLDNALEQIDNARLILTSIIIASVILIIAWTALRVSLYKICDQDKKSQENIII